MPALRWPLVLLLLGGCLSPGTPSPAIRWFDPLPTSGAASPSVGGSWQVAAGPFVRQEFVVRIGERELAIDELHRWIAPPERLVARWLGGSGSGSGNGGGTAATGVLLRFELDTTAAACAVVELQLTSLPGAPIVRGQAPAAASGPAAFAAAMAAALEQIAIAVAAHHRGG